MPKQKRSLEELVKGARALALLVSVAHLKRRTATPLQRKKVAAAFRLAPRLLKKARYPPALIRAILWVYQKSYDPNHRVRRKVLCAS